MDASALLVHQRKNFTGIIYNALIVGQYGSSYYPDQKNQEESARELFLLAETAGIQFSLEEFFYLPQLNTATFFTKGMVEKIEKKIQKHNLNILIVDATLKPNQLRTLEEELNIRVLGRIELILDIFAMRAQSKTSSLQVELAQLVYILPRLKGLGNVLSRQGGGIGTRGPGETMLETDRRHIRRRIQRIQKELKTIEKHKYNTRKNRNAFTFTLVGYTNAGKTSLLNALSSSAQKLFAEDRLFATLDSSSRKVYLGERNYLPVYAIVTDTIGFIRNLPASLIAAFHSTLAEISHTNAIIIVLDGSTSQMEEELWVVEQELEKLELSNKKRILFINKDDLLLLEQKEKILEKYPHAIFGNSIKKDALQELRNKMLLLEEHHYANYKNKKFLQRKEQQVYF